MKCVIIADISGFSVNGKPSAHYWKVASDYKRILRDEFTTQIAGPKTYRHVIDEDYIVLKYNIAGLKTYSVFENLKKIIFELANFRKVIKQKTDIIIFQSSGFLSMLIGLFMTGNRGKDIYIIQYTDRLKSYKYSILYKLVKKHIKGVISGMEHIGRKYSDNVLTMPDYIFSGNMPKMDSFNGCFLICGIMFEGKDIEQALEVFRVRKEQLNIIGHFHNKSRLKKLLSVKTGNVNISDRYLSEKEYDSIIRQSSYLILPYKAHYNNATSGVVYDAIFRGKPVITKALKGMRFVSDYNIGFLYKESIEEFFREKHDYDEYRNNIIRYIENNMKSVNKLRGFIE